MTRKDYIIIADAISNARDRLKHYGWNDFSTENALKEVCWHLSIKLREDNSNFNSDKFFVACGYEEEEILEADEDEVEVRNWA
jgi:hypothetical protein